MSFLSWLCDLSDEQPYAAACVVFGMGMGLLWLMFWVMSEINKQV